VTKKEEGSEFKIISHGTEFIAPDSTFKIKASAGLAEVSVISGNVIMNNPKFDKPMVVPTNTYVEGIQVVKGNLFKLEAFTRMFHV